MGGRPREPINLIKSKGKSHLTKKQIEEREKTEIKISAIDIKIPMNLSEKQKEEFSKISKILLDNKILCELDVNCLSNYVIAKENFDEFTKLLEKELKKKKRDIEIIERYAKLQDKYFKQCTTGERQLGLAPVSRARLIMPKTEEQPKINKFERFITNDF